MPNRVLYCVLAFFIVLYALSFFPRGGERAVSSAFMNEKYAPLLNTVEVENASEKTTLYKKADLWYGISGGTVFPTESKKVSEFIQYLIKVRKLYTISDSNGTMTDKNRLFASV